MQAITKTGEIIIEDWYIHLKRTGLPGLFATAYSFILSPVYSLMGVSTVNKIRITDIRKVEYSVGVENAARPHMKIYYGGKKPRYVIFKRPFADVANYQGAKAELEKTVNELSRLNVKVEKL